MDTLKIRPRKVVVCTHDPLLFTHIDMCLGGNTHSKIKLELHYVGVGKALMNEKQYHDLDVLFIDCALQDIDPIELVQHMRWAVPDFVLILMIDTPEQALKGYELDAFLCLFKNDLFEELNKNRDALMHKLGEGREMLEFRCSDRTHRAYVDEILYAEAVNHSVVVYYRSQNMEPTHIFNTLTAVEEMLAPHGFYRINHSFVINMAYVDRLNHEWVTLASGKQLPVGKNRYRGALATYEGIKSKNKDKTTDK